jgi:hypothetical protein
MILKSPSLFPSLRIEDNLPTPSPLFGMPVQQAHKCTCMRWSNYTYGMNELQSILEYQAESCS